MKMNRMFYSKIAMMNIRKNYRTYVPYILSCIGTIMMFYIMHFIYINDGVQSIPGSEAIRFILQLGVVVVGIFSVILLLYTNSFLIKQRKKEFGVYNILGMEKKHISLILIIENIIISLISLVIGIIVGILFSRLMVLILLKILKFGVSFGFQISPESIFTTLALFAGIFLLSLLSNLIQIYRANIIELMKGGNVGEKEIKVNWVLSVIGAISLGAGYFIAITTKNPIEAVLLFFFAVILVIIGTYSLFTTGSIALLKLLKNNKNYYYKTENFISVSHMMYRMKQNAVGLGNICILSTMVLVMISSTICLYFGMEDSIKSRHARNVVVSTYVSPEQDTHEINSIITAELAKTDYEITNVLIYKGMKFPVKKAGSEFTIYSLEYHTSTNGFASLYLMVSDEYDSNGLLMYNTKGEAFDTISINGQVYEVENLTDFYIEDSVFANNLSDVYILIVPDAGFISDIYYAAYGVELTLLLNFYGFDINGDYSDQYIMLDYLHNNLEFDCIGRSITVQHEYKEAFLMMYGGLFFLGIFLTVLFLMATILIIYYKQISEGYSDKNRYLILQNVGMNKKEIKQSINSQILIVFFFPLGMSIIHICFAFNLITQLLAALGVINTLLFALCVAGTVLLFSVIYTIVYKMTSRVYYNIVKV